MSERFDDELEALRLQVEVMALLVGDALAGACRVLETADEAAAARLVANDDAIDEMHVSLTEHSYRLLARQAPVASDLRLIVSVIRVLSELERIGDLSLRVAKSVTDVPLLARHPDVFVVLTGLAHNVVDRYRAVEKGWSTASIEPLAALDRVDPLDRFADPLANRLMDLRGPDAVRVALASITIGRSLDRIGDHTAIMASRLRYLLTGDPCHLADEVGIPPDPT